MGLRDMTEGVCVWVGVCCSRPAEKMGEAASVRDLLFSPTFGGFTQPVTPKR
jgi:hypothetical protein